MKSLDINIGLEASDKERAIRRFANRVLVIESKEFGKLRGRVVGFKNGYFEFRRPVNTPLSFIADTIYDIYYTTLEKAAVEKPKLYDFFLAENKIC